MIPKEFLDTIEWSTHRPVRTGGQSCGMPNYGIRLISKELGFEISTDYWRSMYQNREFCLTMFELFLQEIKAIK